MENNKSVRRIFKDTFTGKDNDTIDIGRVLWGLGVFSFILFAGYVVFYSKAFDPIAYGAGFAAVLAAGGAAIRIKDGEEPTHSPNKEQKEDK